MRLKLTLGLLFVVVLAACGGPPPTVVYIVVTTTPNETDVARDLTRDAAVTLVAGMNQSVVTLPTSLPATDVLVATSAPDSDTPTPLPTTPAPTETMGPTALPANFPTPMIAQIQVAEQLFEGGRMFWIQPTDQIWVLTITSEGHGNWIIYEDTFKDGEPETDPSLVPPDGRYQPERGFGKLWRESPDLRQTLGWGVTPEFGYVSRYEYHAGGSVDPTTGAYTPGPGYHILFSLGGELFRFNEVDGTWQLGDNS